MILLPRQKDECKIAFQAIKNQRLRVDRLTTQVQAFRRFQLLFLVFHNFKEILRSKRQKILEEAQKNNYDQERMNLAVEMHSFNLKTKAFTSFNKFVELGRELKAKVEVVGKVAIKVNNFKEKLREEKEKVEKEQDEAERHAYRMLIIQQEKEEMAKIRKLRAEEAKRLLLGVETSDNLNEVNKEIADENIYNDDFTDKNEDKSNNLIQESGLSDFIHNEKIVYGDTVDEDKFSEDEQLKTPYHMIQSIEEVRQTLTLRKM